MGEIEDFRAGDGRIARVSIRAGEDQRAQSGFGEIGTTGNDVRRGGNASGADVPELGTGKVNSVVEGEIGVRLRHIYAGGAKIKNALIIINDHVERAIGEGHSEPRRSAAQDKIR